MVRDTGDVELNPGEKFLEIVTAYDRLKIDSDEAGEGEWTVILLIDNRFIGKKNFRIS